MSPQAKIWYVDYREFQGRLRYGENLINVEVDEICDFYGDLLTTGEVLQLWSYQGTKAIRFYKNGSLKGFSEYPIAGFCEVKPNRWSTNKKKKLLWRIPDGVDYDRIKQLKIVFYSEKDKDTFLEKVK